MAQASDAAGYRASQGWLRMVTPVALSCVAAGVPRPCPAAAIPNRGAARASAPDQDAGWVRKKLLARALGQRFSETGNLATLSRARLLKARATLDHLAARGFRLAPTDGAPAVPEQHQQAPRRAEQVLARLVRFRLRFGLPGGDTPIFPEGDRYHPAIAEMDGRQHSFFAFFSRETACTLRDIGCRVDLQHGEFRLADGRRTPIGLERGWRLTPSSFEMTTLPHLVEVSASPPDRPCPAESAVIDRVAWSARTVTALRELGAWIDAERSELVLPSGQRLPVDPDERWASLPRYTAAPPFFHTVVLLMHSVSDPALRAARGDTVGASPFTRRLAGPWTVVQRALEHARARLATRDGLDSAASIRVAPASEPRLVGETDVAALAAGVASSSIGDLLHCFEAAHCIAEMGRQMPPLGDGLKVWLYGELINPDNPHAPPGGPGPAHRQQATRRAASLFAGQVGDLARDNWSYHVASAFVVKRGGGAPELVIVEPRAAPQWLLLDEWVRGLSVRPVSVVVTSSGQYLHPATGAPLINLDQARELARELARFGLKRP